MAGSLPPDELPRLAGAVLEIDSARADVHLNRDEEMRAVVDGEYRLTVRMTCQRCLQSVTQEIEGEMRVAVVWDENQAATLPQRLDPWQVETENADLYELLEEEFLLSLPIVPHHDENECPASGSYSTGEHEEQRENPFSVLAKLKK